MKNKILSLIVILAIFCLLPITTLGFENVDVFEDFNVKYQLFNDGTAKVIYVPKNSNSDAANISEFINYNEERYIVTSIDKDAFKDITTKQDLYIWSENAPKLEDGISFENINIIYVKQGAQGYVKDAGWPEEKVKTFKIELQPQDIVVKAGEITETVSTQVSLPVGAGSFIYNWYYCDKDGNVIDDNPVGENSPIFNIPTDLSYNNENNTSKEYYFKCIIGSDYDIKEATRTVKVTVNPGIYRVNFKFSRLNDSSIPEGVALVNSERKVNLSDIPTLAKIEPYKEGKEFLGWTDNGYDIIDFENKVFDKNTNLYPLWGTKITIDANGGKFADGTTSIVVTATNFDYIIEQNIEEPTREGYKIIDIQDINGEPLLFYLESGIGITEEKTFYVIWEPMGNVGDTTTNNNQNDNSNNQNENNNENLNINTNNKPQNTGNPTTGDNILLFVAIALISTVGIFITTKLRRDAKK